MAAVKPRNLWHNVLIHNLLHYILSLFLFHTDFYILWNRHSISIFARSLQEVTVFPLERVSIPFPFDYGIFINLYLRTQHQGSILMRALSGWTGVISPSSTSHHISGHARSFVSWFPIHRTELTSVTVPFFSSGKFQQKRINRKPARALQHCISNLLTEFSLDLQITVSWTNRRSVIHILITNLC